MAAGPFFRVVPSRAALAWRGGARHPPSSGGFSTDCWQPFEIRKAAQKEPPIGRKQEARRPGNNGIPSPLLFLGFLGSCCNVGFSTNC
jgi:hypothetical protein